jgi:hypothetical protein
MKLIAVMPSVNLLCTPGVAKDHHFDAINDTSFNQIRSAAAVASILENGRCVIVRMGYERGY